MTRLARLSRLRKGGSEPYRGGPEVEPLVAELYRGLLGREPDESGLQVCAAALRSGTPLAQIVRNFVDSDEFSHKQGFIRVAPAELPDLQQLYPERYRLLDGEGSVFIAADDGDIDWLEQAILEHRYYDSFGVWSPIIDLDKRVTAAFVEGLGATSCLELGTFTGAVLSLLDGRGIDVTGVDISHLAFVLAYPSIKGKIRYGDLLSLDLQGPYAAIVAMDILEHLNPRKLPQYLDRIAGLLAPDGYLLVNSPMFGPDDVFGEASDVYLPEWRTAGPESFWRHLHCDARGWPLHGHLVWASPSWWEKQFESHGLVRDRVVERRAHQSLGGFFDNGAPGRRSFFALRHAGSTRQSADVAAEVGRALDAVIAAG